MNNSLLSSLVATVILSTGLFANTVVATAGGTKSNSYTSSGDKSLFKADELKTYVQAKKYTTADIENDIKGASGDSLSLLNNINNLLIKKKNPIDGKVEAAVNGVGDAGSQNVAIISAMTQIRANVAEAARLLSVDYKAFSEKDKKALDALTKSNKKLRNEISALSKTIPVSNSNLQLGSVRVPVLGTTQTQVFPIMEGEKSIGTLRVVCGAYLEEDQLINNDSVNYCIASTWSNSATRISDFHKKATTDTYFTGISEAYVPGKVNYVTIKWDTQAKVAVRGMLKYYNITDEETLKTMSYENTVIDGNGVKYPGKRAMIQK